MNMHLFVELMFVVVGVLTYVFRNTPNPYIGIRLGYTYLSKEAWKRANTFAALYCISLGMLLLFLDLTLQLSNNAFVLLILVGLVPMIVITYRIAKETYEKEDIKVPMDEEPKPLEMVGIMANLLVQLVMVMLYFLIVAILWDRLPNTVATHFNIYGNPDSFMDKFSGTILAPAVGMGIVPIVTALIAKEPMLIRFPIYGKGQKLLLALLTLLQAFIFVVMIAVLLYNANMVSFGVWFSLLVAGFVVFLLGWIYWMWKHYSVPI